MKASKLTPNFEVNNIKQTVGFYSKHFGFDLIMAVPASQDGVEQVFDENKEYVYAMVRKDNVELFFQQSSSFKQDIEFMKELAIGASVSFYIEVEGINEFYETLKSKDLQVTDLQTKWYGMQEFYTRDINGYVIGFAEKI